jgi:hypothetical protein
MDQTTGAGPPSAAPGEPESGLHSQPADLEHPGPVQASELVEPGHVFVPVVDQTSNGLLVDVVAPNLGIPVVLGRPVLQQVITKPVPGRPAR